MQRRISDEILPNEADRGNLVEGKPRSWRFEGFEFDLRRGELRGSDGAAVALRPKAELLLRAFVAQPGCLLSREGLMQSVWPGTVVTDDSLVQCVRELRAALNDRTQRLIRTVPRRGYRFDAEIEQNAQSTVVPPAQTHAQADASISDNTDTPVSLMEYGSRGSYCRATDGVKLAVARFNSGPAVVRASNYMAQVGFSKDDPLVQPLIRAFERYGSYVTFDARGCGLSQREVSDLSFEAWVRDLGSVVDHVGQPQVSLFGMSQGAAVAIAYAARHPERVRCLLLHGGYLVHRFCSVDADICAKSQAMIRLAEVGWGLQAPEMRQFWVSQLMPDASFSLQQRVAERLLYSMSGDVAARYLHEIYSIDVRDLASQVRCPVLVTHYEDDRNVPIALGVDLASSLCNSRFVRLTGNNHAPVQAGESWKPFVQAVSTFLQEISCDHS